MTTPDVKLSARSVPLFYRHHCYCRFSFEQLLPASSRTKTFSLEGEFMFASTRLLTKICFRNSSLFFSFRYCLVSGDGANEDEYRVVVLATFQPLSPSQPTPDLEHPRTDNEFIVFHFPSSIYLLLSERKTLRGCLS